MKNILVMAATALTLTACAGAGEKEADIIDKPDYKSETGVFDIEALEALGRVSAVQVSPATKKVLFNISYESVEQNRSNADLYVMNPTVPTCSASPAQPARKAISSGSTKADRSPSPTQ